VKGYYQMHRGWMDNPVFAPQAFTEREAFEWLISEATWSEDRTVSHKGNPVRVERGQVPHSIRFMAHAWGWTKDKTSRFLNKLEKWDMIATQTATGQHIITICNYDKYQAGATQTATDSAPVLRRDRDETATNYKKDKERKEGKKAAPYSELFEEAWKAYPTTPIMSKQDGWRAWQKATRPESDLVKAVKAYAELLRKPDAPYAAHFATFFNGHRYEGFLAETEAAKATEADNEAMVASLAPLERVICNALSPEVYRSWLNDAKIRDGPEVEITFRSAFQRDHFEQRLAGKAEKAVGKKLICRTGT
jgi:hypothetical protein